MQPVATVAELTQLLTAFTKKVISIHANSGAVLPILLQQEYNVNTTFRQAIWRHYKELQHNRNVVATPPQCRKSTFESYRACFNVFRRYDASGFNLLPELSDTGQPFDEFAADFRKRNGLDGSE